MTMSSMPLLSGFLGSRGARILQFVLWLLLLPLYAVALVYLTHQGLARQLINLLADLETPFADEIGAAIAYIVLFGAVISKTSKNAGRWIVVGIVIITVCVFLVRVKVVNTHMAEAQARYAAAQTTYSEAKKNKAEAIADAKADKDLNARAPYLNRKREARENLRKARAMPLPPVPLAPSLGWEAWLVAVVGPAGIELATSIIIKVLGGALGSAFMVVLLPPGRDDATNATVHPMLEGVELERLSVEAREGLDVEAGTWRDLALGPPAIKGKGRDATLWPTLDTNGARNIFIGTGQALARVHQPHLRLVDAGSSVLDDVLSRSRPS